VRRILPLLIITGLLVAQPCAVAQQADTAARIAS